uniref:Xylanolytic transcriptional activator regulatory domain-containing protein n=1 Tax=Bionectria ochroleuca TaxID=29856 RepID=A0A0B7KI67_BIOOC
MESQIQSTTKPTKALSVPNHVLQAIRTVPPRPYTDGLVKNFFNLVNYHYCILHQPHFMTQYTKWWSTRPELRGSPSCSDISFTCLVLRICSNSTQFLTPSDIHRFESELGESISVLGANYNTAAQTLSDYLPSGSGGLSNAQQLFLAATWSKAEGDFVSSWHQLAAAVRHAQEIGIHNDSSSDEMTDMERELRRRLWCSVWTWDRFMVGIFNRASIIQSNEPVPLPNPKLDQTRDDPEIPSIVLTKVLENQLTRQLYDDSQKDADLDAKLALVENFMDRLPSVFRLNGADVRWDTKHPRLVAQRLQLHTTCYMAKMILLRPTVLDIERCDPNRLSHTIELSLKCMEVSRKLFDACVPQHAKYFMVTFAPFDNASFLASIVIKAGRKRQVPRRSEVLAAIGQAIYMCNKLREFTKLGATTWTILMALASKFILDASERTIFEQIGRIRDESGPTERPFLEPGIGHDEPLIRQPDSISNLVDISETDWGMWGASEPSAQVDLGILDGMWDWNGLGLGDMGSG